MISKIKSLFSFFTKKEYQKVETPVIDYTKIKFCYNEDYSYPVLKKEQNMRIKITTDDEFDRFIIYDILPAGRTYTSISRRQPFEIAYNLEYRDNTVCLLRACRNGIYEL